MNRLAFVVGCWVTYVRSSPTSNIWRGTKKSGAACPTPAASDPSPRIIHHAHLLYQEQIITNPGHRGYGRYYTVFTPPSRSFACRYCGASRALRRRARLHPLRSKLIHIAPHFRFYNYLTRTSRLQQTLFVTSSVFLYDYLSGFKITTSVD